MENVLEHFLTLTEPRSDVKNYANTSKINQQKPRQADGMQCGNQKSHPGIALNQIPHW